MDSQSGYAEQRARVELELARIAAHPSAAKSHSEMAQLYLALARGGRPSGDQSAVDAPAGTISTASANNSR